METPRNVVSVDVEDWFHILELETTPDISSWNGLESRVCRNTRLLLDVFDSAGAKVTCFFLGWSAERFPELVRDVRARGHEIACHGYAHRLVYTQTPEEFLDDIRKAKAIIEDISGEAVLGYRAPGFSIVSGTPWAFDQIVRAGYRYDSSVFPSARGHGGMAAARMDPHVIDTKHGPLWEFPASVAEIFGRRVCFFGGGYLRLFPYFLIRRMTERVNRGGRPVNYYVHPREIDPSHPRIPMGAWRRFKSYVNLGTTLPKVNRIIRDNRLATFRDQLALLPAAA